MSEADKQARSARPSRQGRDLLGSAAEDVRPPAGPAGLTSAASDPEDGPDTATDALARRLGDVRLESSSPAGTSDAASQPVAAMDSSHSKEPVDSETESDAGTATPVNEGAQEKGAERQVIIDDIMRSLRAKLDSKLSRVIAAAKASKPEVEVAAKEWEKKEATSTEGHLEPSRDEAADEEEAKEVAAEVMPPVRSSFVDSDALAKGKAKKFGFFRFPGMSLSRKESSSPSSTISAAAPPSISAGAPPPPPPPAPAPAVPAPRSRVLSRWQSKITDELEGRYYSARRAATAPALASALAAKPQVAQQSRAPAPPPAAAPRSSLREGRALTLAQVPSTAADFSPAAVPPTVPPHPIPPPHVEPQELPPPPQIQPGPSYVPLPGPPSYFGPLEPPTAPEVYPGAFANSAYEMPGGPHVPLPHQPPLGMAGMPGLPAAFIDDDIRARINALSEPQQAELFSMAAAEPANPFMQATPIVPPVSLGALSGPMGFGLPHYALMRQDVTLQEPEHEQLAHVSSPAVGEQSSESVGGTPDTHGAKHAHAWDEGAASDHDGRRKKPKRVATEKGVSGEASKKFACPYFKRNRKKYSKWTSCPGPGWDEVHRVKTHLYRRHALPIQCPRCWEVFKEDKVLSLHLQQNPPCTSRENYTLVEGFTKDQEKKLRSRKKAQADTTDEDKWREIYMILFPDDDPASIPSPYYDAIYEEGDDGNSPRAGDIEDYATFIKREMPTLVRRELETLFQDEFQDVEEHLRPRVADIVLKLQPKLLGLYKQSQMPLSEYGPSNDSNGPDLTPALSQRTGDTGSTPVTEGGFPPSTDSFHFDENAIFDFDVSNMGLGSWDFGSEQLAQGSEYTTSGFSWDYEFDKLINPGLFLPQGGSRPVTYSQNTAAHPRQSATWQHPGYSGRHAG